jgi:hypothetical protein
MLIFAVGCFYLFAPGLLAQNGGSITGSVVDIAGEPVAKAAIQATNSETNAVYKATTSAQGAYTLTQLPAGTYRLSSAARGFVPFVQSGVAVPDGKAVALNLQFEDVQLNTLGDGREFFASLSAGRHKVTGPTPRMPDGKPDLSGVWYPQATVDPGKPEGRPWAEAIRKERDENNGKDFPPTFCLPDGVMFSDVYSPWRTVYTAAYMALISEDDTPGFRQIYLDGRDHPKNFGPTWNGHSIGHWEGDTLVVDTVGFNDKSWLPNSYPHTEKLHLTERYRRPDLGRMEIEFTIEDPDTFNKPWVIKRTADLAPNEEVLEMICNENERDREHMVGR